MASGWAQADALDLALTRNELCADAGVASLVFKDVKSVPSNIDFCQVPTELLPETISQTLNTVNQIHHRMAEVLSSTVEGVFGLDFTISVLGNMDGPLISAASGMGMLVGAFPDWQPKDFPRQVYAHELVHVLTFNGGAFSTPLAGLRLHPFLIEALPDLIASEINSSPVLDLGDSTLPKCVNDLRDGTPLQSLNLPFHQFSKGGSAIAMRQCCASIPSLAMTSRIQAICGAYLGGMVPTIADGHLPFQPQRCFMSRGGMTDFGACDTHQFGQPLVSFFTSLQQKLGRSLVKGFVSAMTRQRSLAKAYQCRYVRPAMGYPVKAVTLLTRGVVSVFDELKQNLSTEEQAIFAQVWSEHAYEKLVELEAIYAVRAAQIDAIRELGEKNSTYMKTYGCESVQKMNPRACEIRCEAL